MFKQKTFFTLILLASFVIPTNLALQASYNSAASQWEDTVSDTAQEITYQYNYSETGNGNSYGYYEMIIGSDNPALSAGQALKITSILDQWNLTSTFGLTDGLLSRDIDPNKATWTSGQNLNIRFGAQMPVSYCTTPISTGGCDISQATLGNNIQSITTGSGNGLITIKARIDSSAIPNPASSTIYTLRATQGGQIIHPLGYNINPKGWQIKIDLANPSATTLKLMLNLAGAYNPITKQMNAGLQSRNLIPASSPYQTTAQAVSIPANGVDWVYLQLLQNGNIKYAKSLILLTSGETIDPINPTKLINLTSLPSGNYQVIVMHRNHLSISTDQDITISPNTPINLDLRGNVNVRGLNQTGLGDNQFGLKAGNVNDDLYINSSDRVLVRNQRDTANVYSDYDINLDGQISSLDRSLSRLGKESASML